MQTHISIILILALGYLNWHCTNETGDLKKREQIAEGYCECAANLAALDMRAGALPDTSVFLTAMLDSMQREYEKVSACLLPLRTANGLIKPGDIPEIQRILQSKCPDLARNKELMIDLLCR